MRYLIIVYFMSLIYNGNSQELISLVGKLKITGLPIHDVWGYTDQNTNKKYALLGASTSGLRVIDLSDLTKPKIAGTISGNGVNAIDVKTWKNYAYVVGESSSISGKIIDLSDPTNPKQVGDFPAGHNMSISSKGYMYLASRGVRIFDLNSDPTKPKLVFTDNSCKGHDISIVGNRLYDFSDNCGTRIFDVSKPDTLIAIGTVPPSGIFHHSGWPTADGKFLFICDELARPAENDITTWDISDLKKPVLIDSFADANAYVHNLYVIDNYAYVSYYSAGFRVFDVTNPNSIRMAVEYDTDSTFSGPGYGGNFGLFTEWGSDTILASDEENGLFIFSLKGLKTSVMGNNESIFQFKIYPNPANESISVNLKEVENSKLKIVNAQGKIIQNWVFGEGKTIISFSTSQFPQGLYYMIVSANNTLISKSFTVVH